MEPKENILIKNKTEVLEKVALLDSLKANQLAMNSIAELMEFKSYSTGTYLTTEGLEGVEYFILIKGEVSIRRNTPEGDSYKVVVLNASKHPSFGEGGLIEGERRSATIVCETDVECLILMREQFQTFCQSHPEYALPIVIKIAQALIGRLNQTSRDMMLLHKALMDEIRSN